MSAGAPYRIVVQSFGSVAGQFVISVQTSTVPVAAALPLPLGQAINGLVGTQTASLTYSLSDPNFGMLLLTVTSTDAMGAADAPSLILRDAQTGETLAVISGRMMGNP